MADLVERLQGYRYDAYGRHPRAPQGFAFCKVCRVRARKQRFNSEGLCRACETAEPFDLFKEGQTNG